MSKLRVLAIPSDAHGVGKYRVLDPFKFIGNNFNEDVHVDIVMNLADHDDVFNNYDVVIFHSFIHQVNHERNVERVKWLKNKGIKTIMDIDDFWTVDQRHPMYEQIKIAKIGEKKAELLKLVDYVTCTTSFFATEIKKRLGLRDNVFVFPNAVDENEPQFKPNPIKSDRIRFGWLGGSSHLHDIELLKSGIESTQNNYLNKTQFVLCGFDLRGTVTEIDRTTGQQKQRPIMPHETVWSKYESIFTSSYKVLDNDYKNFLTSFKEGDYPSMDVPYIRRWTQDISKYAMNYNYFDVSLAPLVESFFNSCKSQLKVIEAGFHKKAIIASETCPYTIDLVSAVDSGVFNDKGNALLVPERKNHKEWAKHMKRLVENPALVEDLGNRLYETVKDTYSLKKVCNDRVQFLKSVVNK
jgi:glycosyltransferase involved in cell wall biosynthesis